MVGVAGFAKVTPACLGKWKVSDSRGVLSLHGLPGIVGALASFLVAGLLNVDAYGVQYTSFSSPF